MRKHFLLLKTACEGVRSLSLQVCKRMQRCVRALGS